MIAGHENEAARDHSRRRGGLALLDDHAPSAVIACLNAIRINDREAVAATVPPDVPVIDRRSGSNRRFHDGRTLVDTLATWGTEHVFDLSLLAHRGANHALVRLDLALREGVMSCLIRATCRGDQVEQLAVYDPADLGLANYELAMSWANERPPAEAATIQATSRWLRAILERDFEELAARTTDGFVIVDHRRDSAHRHDPEGSRELLHGVLADEDELMDLVTEVVGVNERAILVWRTQTTAGRLEAMDEELALTTVRDGRVERLEFFEANQIDAALRSLAQAGGSGSPAGAEDVSRVTSHSEERAVRRDLVPGGPGEAGGELDWRHPGLFVHGDLSAVLVSFLEAARTGDRALLNTLLAGDAEVEDLRSRTDTLMQSREDVLHGVERFGRNAFDVRLVALREERLAVVRLLFERTEGGIADIAALLRSQGDRVVGFHLYDTAAFPDVVRRLSEAHLEMLDPGQRAVLGVSASVISAIVGREFDQVAQLLTADFVYRDHREATPIELNRGDALGLLSAAIEESPDVFDYAPEVLRLSSTGLLTTRTQTTLDRLGRTDVDLVAMGVRDGRLRAFEIFERDSADRAQRLLASWH